MAKSMTTDLVGQVVAQTLGGWPFNEEQGGEAVVRAVWPDESGDLWLLVECYGGRADGALAQMRAMNAAVVRDMHDKPMRRKAVAR